MDELNNSRRMQSNNENMIGNNEEKKLKNIHIEAKKKEIDVRRKTDEKRQVNIEQGRREKNAYTILFAAAGIADRGAA
jgi:hypothetical protein